MSVRSTVEMQRTSTSPNGGSNPSGRAKLVADIATGVLREWYQLGKPSGRKAPPTHVKHLLAYREECKHTGGMSLECQIATTLISFLRFYDAFEHGPREDWNAQFRALRGQLKDLRELLASEYPGDEPPHKATKVTSNDEED